VFPRKKSPFRPAPRCTADRIEEASFARRGDRFSALEPMFFDTTSIAFAGEGGETLGERDDNQDHRSDLKQLIVGDPLLLPLAI
jgi:hypothetical protein